MLSLSIAGKRTFLPPPMKFGLGCSKEQSVQENKDHEEDNKWRDSVVKWQGYSNAQFAVISKIPFNGCL